MSSIRPDKSQEEAGQKALIQAADHKSGQQQSRNRKQPRNGRATTQMIAPELAALAPSGSGQIANNGTVSQAIELKQRREQQQRRRHLTQAKSLVKTERRGPLEEANTEEAIGMVSAEHQLEPIVVVAGSEMATTTTTTTGDQSHESDSAHLEHSPSQDKNNDDKRPLIERNGSNGRKWSQCSDASSSFGCSLDYCSSALEDGAGGSRRSSSVCTGLGGQDQHQHQRQPNVRQKGPKLRAIDKLARKSSSIVDCFRLNEQPVANGSRQANGSGGRGRDASPSGQQTPAMSRTISQSMLQLDESSVSPGDKFEIYWTDLAFAYRPTNVLARLGAKLKLGLTKLTGGESQKLVLRHVSGSFRSNQLVAIIGPSGCGKTTLLQFLAGNNGHQRERLRIRGLEEPKVAYIGQDDCLLPGLTARETLMYASRLQNNRHNFDHAQHIQPILNELGLVECAERNVAKLSGGQAKRVTIAQELLYPTNLLILDEVTSGLDASTSYSIVKLLKYLVSDQRYPMSIVMSIHQPSARLFSVFDQVYVMSDGCCLYEGSCELSHINERLAKFALTCPPYHNIADYLIELACSGTSEEAAPRGAASSEQKLRLRKDQEPADDWLLGEAQVAGQSEPPAKLRAQMIEYQHKLQDQAGRSRPSGQLDNCDSLSSSLYLAIERARQRRQKPFLEHFQIHLWRSLLRIRRSYILTYLQLATYIVLGLQLATFYGPDIGRLSGCPRLPMNLINYVLVSGSTNGGDGDDRDDLAHEVRRIQENMNFLLVAVMLATFAALEITVITFPLEAKTIKREWRNGWYSVSSYFAGRTLADLPFQLVFVAIFCLLVYVMTGQNGLEWWRFGSFVLIIVLTALVAQSFGFMFGAMFMDNLPAAVFTAPLAIFPALLFSGFFSRVSQIPAFYKPLTYLSHFRYAFDALLVTLYGFNRCQCDQATLTSYHASMRNQTGSMREMFSYLFGASDCAPATTSTTEDYATTSTSSPADMIAQDDLNAIQATNSTLAAQLFKTIVQNAPDAGAAVTTVAPTHSATDFMRPIQDALVDSLYEQMTHRNSSSPNHLNNSAASLLDDQQAGDGSEPTSVMDRLADRFATRLTAMLNKQANFGHQMPTTCRQFNSYLLTEFGLNDEDLLFGLLMLLLVVLITRLVCNCLLNFTIATRTK